LKLCPGCGDLVRGRCPRGCVKGGKTQTPHRVAHQELHQSREWRADYRPAVLERDGYTCRACGAGPLAPAELVCDLLVELERFTWSLHEAQTLCFPCSGRKDGGRRRGPTMAGAAATRRRRSRHRSSP
jgi:hypothetical protein